MKAQNSVYLISQSKQQKNLPASSSFTVVSEDVLAQIPCAHFMFALPSQAQPLEIPSVRISTQSWFYSQVPKGPSAWNTPVSL